MQAHTLPRTTTHSFGLPPSSRAIGTNALWKLNTQHVKYGWENTEVSIVLRPLLPGWWRQPHWVIGRQGPTQPRKANSPRAAHSWSQDLVLSFFWISSTIKCVSEWPKCFFLKYYTVVDDIENLPHFPQEEAQGRIESHSEGKSDVNPKGTRHASLLCFPPTSKALPWLRSLVSLLFLALPLPLSLLPSPLLFSPPCWQSSSFSLHMASSTITPSEPFSTHLIHEVLSRKTLPHHRVLFPP